MLSITSTVAPADPPLSPVSARFPLGLGTYAAPTSSEAPSDTGARPFGLRFALAGERSAVEALPLWRYCPRRQIAVVDDGTGEAWFRRLAATGTGSKSTTGPSPDGGPSTGNEEWTPDFMGDASA